MRTVPITVHGDVSRATAERLGAELRDLRTLAAVIAWTRAQRPPLTVADIVTQDEYTHDVLVVLEPRLCLVFDAT